MDKVLTLEERTLLLEVYLKHHLQDTVMPDASLYEISPILNVMMEYFTSGADLQRCGIFKKQSKTIDIGWFNFGAKL